jgi:hypothetical protein
LNEQEEVENEERRQKPQKWGCPVNGPVKTSPSFLLNDSSIKGRVSQHSTAVLTNQPRMGEKGSLANAMVPQ